MARAWLLAVCLVAGGCSSRWSAAIAELPSPAAAQRTGQPQLTALDGRAILSWIERDGDRASLKFAERTATGWTEARVAAAGEGWFVNWADVPSVVRLSDGTFAAHWLEKSAAETYAYDVKLSFSKDGGSWSAPTTPHHDNTPTEHGFVSMYPAPQGGLGLVWLDGRSAAAMALRSAVFGSDGTQRSESLIDDRVCECCPTAAVATADGVIAAYRNRSDEETRDIYVARLAGGSWNEPAAVHDDGWRIDACPVNGPALSARGNDVAVAWFNAKVDQGHAFVAFSSDGGKRFTAPTRIDDASALGRVDVELLDDGSAVVAWIEYAEQRAQFRIRRVTASGDRSASMPVSDLASGRASGYPRLARAGSELLFAWTESGDGNSRVRTAAAPIP